MEQCSLLKRIVFSNLQDPDVQREIKNLCQGKSGVYLITNLKTQNRYIDSAITKKPTLNRLYSRFRNHFFNTHKSFLITLAVKKHGIHNFSWEILEFTDRETTRARETYYIQLLKPEYNVLQLAESSLGFRHSTREKMKLKYSQERRDFIGNLNKNKHLSLETRQKLAQAVKNRTQQQKKKHQQICDVFNKAKFSKPTQLVDAQTGEVLGTYPSLISACRSWNGNYRTWKRCVKSGTKINKFNIYVNYIS